MSASTREGGGCFLFDTTPLQTSPRPFFHALVFFVAVGVDGVAVGFSTEATSKKKIKEKSKSKIKYLMGGDFREVAL